jgi:hypothetical protein
MTRIVHMIFDWAEPGIGTVRIAGRLTEQGAEPFGNHPSDASATAS